MLLLPSWIVLGLFAGIVANRIPRRSGAGIVSDVSVGVTGAVIGGLLFGLWAPRGLADDILMGSVLPAGIGAAVFLAAYIVIGRRFARAHE